MQIEVRPSLVALLSCTIFAHYACAAKEVPYKGTPLHGAYRSHWPDCVGFDFFFMYNVENKKIHRVIILIKTEFITILLKHIVKQVIVIVVNKILLCFEFHNLCYLRLFTIKQELAILVR